MDLIAGANVVEALAAKELFDLLAQAQTGPSRAVRTARLDDLRCPAVSRG
jgi:hypothetical protein